MCRQDLGWNSVYQVYEDFRMAKGSTTSVAKYDSFGTPYRRLLVDQVDGERRVHLLLLVDETGLTVVIGFPLLQDKMRIFLRRDITVRARRQCASGKVQRDNVIGDGDGGKTHLAGVRSHFFRFPRVLGETTDGLPGQANGRPQTRRHVQRHVETLRLSLVLRAPFCQRHRRVAFLRLDITTVVIARKKNIWRTEW